jgi:outer membrane protein assembly factor BamA
MDVPGLSISLCSSAAAILPFNLGALFSKSTAATATTPSVLLSDRFYSGNHLFARGFAPNTIGPRAAARGSGGCPEGDVLGGQLRYNALAAVSAPIPVDSLAKHGARAFGFCSAAAVLTPSAWQHRDLTGLMTGRGGGALGAQSPLAEILGAARVSVGWGLSLPIGPARLELSYSLPLLKASSDSVRQFQVGLGISIS